MGGPTRTQPLHRKDPEEPRALWSLLLWPLIRSWIRHFQMAQKSREMGWGVWTVSEADVDQCSASAFSHWEMTLSATATSAYPVRPSVLLFLCLSAAKCWDWIGLCGTGHGLGKAGPAWGVWNRYSRLNGRGDAGGSGHHGTPWWCCGVENSGRGDARELGIFILS